MSKKKTKRVDSSKVLESQWADRRKQFYESGALVSIILLALFVVLSSMILTFGTPPDTEENILRLEGWQSYLHATVIMLILATALGLYVAASEPDIVKNHIRGIHLILLMLVMFALVRLLIVQGLSVHLIVVPVMITAIMMTIIYNQRFALGVSSFLVLISVLAMADRSDSLRQGLGIIFTAGGGASIAVMLLKKIRSFSKLIEVAALTGAIIFLLTFVVGLWQGLAIWPILENCLYGSLGALTVGFLMQGLLPLIERLFHTATDLTLLAYGEATKPLLKRLAVEAPGTFNHSWQIGMLTEAAAEAIGANGLLCRVGSYYHDVGKLNKPRYFIENQEEKFNQHKELSPTMSRMIIVGHVKDGLELMAEYKIPKVLHQFTATHHGTTLVEYFYHEATKKQTTRSDQGVDETDFRYPGPKPASREAAIVMLADAVEGATRAMQEPTPSRIEIVVHTMAMKRLQDGQFDLCDLTMRQLHFIEKSLIKSLCAMYHGRIAYPKTDKPAKFHYEAV